jgi:glycerol dehydrogenase
VLTTSIFPGRYVQGAHALASLGEEVKRLASNALVLVDGFVAEHLSGVVAEGLADLPHRLERFEGECCRDEIDRLVALAGSGDIDAIVGIGGGKAMDTAKAVAHELGCPVVIVPTLASTDAPCSALSVIYTPEGQFESYLVLPRNPDVVLVDTAVIARAPVRFLVAGIGDALATWFEAESCQIRRAANMTGRPGTMTAYGLARLCYDTLLEHGLTAKIAAEQGVVVPALEHVVEANTLLSGLGFESGGLAACHAIHNGLTVLDETHAYWHGEKVAIGVLAALFLTDEPKSQIDETYEFCIDIGLPVTLADIGLAEIADERLMQVAEAACAPGETIHHEPHEVSPETVFWALKMADAEGWRRRALRDA